MINKILQPTALPYKEARFPQPPAGAYIVYMDDVATDGPDYKPSILTHGVTFELYATRLEELKAAEAKIETQITAAGLQWTKQAAYWLQTEQLYQTVYEFEYIEKRRI
ncbi:MAG: hypothetical protein IKY89_05580 [Alistipes sp.]|nr:hypothetical protein [Alistipes sp.]